MFSNVPLARMILHIYLLCLIFHPQPCNTYHTVKATKCFEYALKYIILLPGLRKVYPYYFTFTTFTKGRWVGERILDVFAREFRAHPAEEYERCIKAGTLTVNYEKVPTDYKLKHNDLLANVVHRWDLNYSPIYVIRNKNFHTLYTGCFNEPWL